MVDNKEKNYFKPQKINKKSINFQLKKNARKAIYDLYMGFYLTIFCRVKQISHDNKMTRALM